MTESTGSKNVNEYKVVVEKLAFTSIKEQKTRRKWRIYFIILGFIYFTPLVLLTVTPNTKWFARSLIISSYCEGNSVRSHTGGIDERCREYH